MYYYYLGAGHADELKFLFTSGGIKSFNIDKDNKTSAEYKMMERMIEMWTNFAKTG